MLTKQAHADALKKIAETEARDEKNAFEAGFVKAASDMGLTEAEYADFYAAGMAKLTPAK